MSTLKIVISTLVVLISGTTYYQTNKNSMMENSNHKKVNVWDTYVTKKDGGIMHFDILAPVEISDTTTIYNYGKEYLITKGQEGQPISSKQCRLCHVEHLRPEWEADIIQKGYFIIEMEGCD